MAIGKIQIEADERFVKKIVEQTQLNAVQSIPGKIAEIEKRLKAGGL